MPFSIRFLPEQAEESELGNAAQFGEIELGDETETFSSLIGFWSPRDYTRQWKQGLERAVSGRDSCLITSLHDPQAADVLHWWLLYPQGESVAVQNALLMVGDLRRPFETADPYTAIPPHRTRNEDGFLISEWSLPVRDLKAFLLEL